MIFELEQLRELLKSDNPHFRKIAQKSIVDDFHIYSDLFFDCLTQNSDDDDLIGYACQRFPMLNGGFAETVPCDFRKDYHYFAGYAAGYRLFLDKLDHYLNNLERREDGQWLLTYLYQKFEGIRADLQIKYPGCYYHADCQDEDGRQLMVFITGKCNLQCPYCFSYELQPTEMLLSDFEEIIRWASANRVMRISLCGGEPTSHSQFDEILALIGKYGLKTYFASNFTIDCISLQRFNAEVIDKIYIHLTNETIGNPQLINSLYKNIHYAKKQGIALMFRTNITDKVPPVDQWLQIMKETDLPVLNIALTFPGRHLKNQFVGIHLFEEYTEVIRKIIDETGKLNIALSFAKPIPLCIFDEQTQRYLLARENFHPICGIHYRNYTNNVCISPEMNIHPCLGVTHESLKFRQDRSWEDVENFCVDIIRPLIDKPLFDKCADCFLFDRKLCQGACLSYKTML